MKNPLITYYIVSALAITTGCNTDEQTVSSTDNKLVYPSKTELILETINNSPSKNTLFQNTNDCDAHISPQGLGDGRRAETAAPIENINLLINRLSDGGTLCLHPGVYNGQYMITEGGSADAPITISGLNNDVTFTNNFDASEQNKSGEAVFEIHASHLIFQGINFSHVGNCFRFPVDSTDITLRNFRANHVAACINIDKAKDHVVSKLNVSNAMILQFSWGGILLASNTHNVILEDVYIDMQPEHIGGRGVDYATGIGLFNDVHDVIIRRISVLNVLGKTDGYTQGDGIDAEASVSNILIEDSYFKNSQDACIDTKANMVIRNTVAIGCKRNYRLWQDLYPNGPRCENCISYQPYGDAHFGAYSNIGFISNSHVFSNNHAQLVSTSDGNPGSLDIDGLYGTLRSNTELGPISDVIDNQLTYDQTFTIPAIPNPTSFTP